MRAMALTLAAMASMASGARSQVAAPAPAPAPAPAERSWQDFLVDLVTQDPGDSLYRAGQRAFREGSNREARGLFRQLRERYPRSARVSDALYWEAFALQRMGRNQDLREARTLLREQERRFPEAATGRDARALATRIDGLLARQGDADAAASITVGAQGECPDERDDVRAEALNALMNMNADNALPILEKVLARRDRCSVRLRRKAVFLVSQKHSPQTTSVLLDAARNDPDREVREQAVFWLSQVNSDEALAALEQILADPEDDEIHKKAIFAVSQHHSSRAARILRAYAEDGSKPIDVRANAIFWLGQQGGQDSGPYLRELYARLDDRDLKEKVIFAVSQQASQENVRWLLALVTSQSEGVEVRKKALFWAGQSGAAFEELVGLYGRMDDRELKKQLIFVYSQHSSRQAVDELMSIARNEQDRELRRKAVFWLGQSGDPRVVEFLMEIIDR